MMRVLMSLIHYNSIHTQITGTWPLPSNEGCRPRYFDIDGSRVGVPPRMGVGDMLWETHEVREETHHSRFIYLFVERIHFVRR